MGEGRLQGDIGNCGITKLTVATDGVIVQRIDNVHPRRVREIVLNKCDQRIR